MKRTATQISDPESRHVGRRLDRQILLVHRQSRAVGFLDPVHSRKRTVGIFVGRTLPRDLLAGLQGILAPAALHHPRRVQHLDAVLDHLTLRIWCQYLDVHMRHAPAELGHGSPMALNVVLIEACV